MTNPVLASICIPTTRRLEFFQEALESAASQSFQDYEILVSVNSEDPNYFPQVAAAVTEMRAGHPVRAIRLVRPPRFLHIADHANFMIDQTAGVYWCYLPDDDRMEPTFLETLAVLLAAHDDAGFAFGNYSIIDGDGALREDLSKREARITHRDRLKGGYIPHDLLPRVALWNAIWLPCSLIRRSVLQEFPFEPGNDAADRDFWLRIADAPVPFGAAFTPVSLLHYRSHELQYTVVRTGGRDDLIRALERCRSVAQVEPDLHAQELALAYAQHGKALLDQGNRTGAWRAMLFALRTNLRDPRIYRLALQTLVPLRWLNYLRRWRGTFGSSAAPAVDAANTPPELY